MKLFQRFWSALTYALNIANLPPLDGHTDYQKPLFDTSPAVISNYGGPIFKPPGRHREGDGSDFLCDYSNMGPDWYYCSTPNDRGCWLKANDGRKFDIHTDYEFALPRGILRQYTLIITDGWINADGLNFTYAKLANGGYPGPWLQACWGDQVEVKVVNNMVHNGTAIHWHGIRQNQTMHMDGVPGITQCPIAPGDSDIYKWNVTQYGSSWYHSHYSLQYADGLLGPLTLHGPSSDNYDEASDIPLLMTDWGHNSAFEAIYNNELQFPSILLNGRGNVSRYSGVPARLPIPETYTLLFEKRPALGRPMRYLLRLINTSWKSAFVFSIDNHELTIVGADFVPIHSYKSKSVTIGIGQRYHVIVEAKPIGDRQVQRTKEFWMRTFVVCQNTASLEPGYELNGILRYDNSSTALPNTEAWSDISKACADEPYTSLVPILPWQVGGPANTYNAEKFDILLNVSNPRPQRLYPVAAFSLGASNLSNVPTFSPDFTPLRIDYSDPTFLHLNNTSEAWPAEWVVIPEEYTGLDWVYMILAGTGRKKNYNTIGAHPIHLHGHDFALLQQETNVTYDITKLNLKLDNPPRRDVVLLPENGFVVIAFKSDNPGTWLVHCHIANHASEGLALQIMEAQTVANEIWPWNTSEALAVTRKTCQNWDVWQKDCRNWWGGCERLAGATGKGKAFVLQDDSGI